MEGHHFGYSILPLLEQRSGATDVEFHSSEDDPSFDIGTTQRHHKVEVMDLQTSRKRISMIRSSVCYKCFQLSFFLASTVFLIPFCAVCRKGEKNFEVDSQWEIVPAGFNEMDDVQTSASMKTGTNQPIPDVSQLSPVNPRSPVETQTNSSGGLIRNCIRRQVPFDSAIGGSHPNYASDNSSSTHAHMCTHPTQCSWTGNLGAAHTITGIEVKFARCDECRNLTSVTIEVSGDNLEWRHYSYVGGVNFNAGLRNRLTFLSANNVQWVRINHTAAYDLTEVKVYSGCQTWFPAPPGARRPQVPQRNPRVHVSARTQISADIEGSDHDVVRCRESRTARVDTRDGNATRASSCTSPGQTCGRPEVGLSSVGSLFQLRRLSNIILEQRDSNYNLNSNPNQCRPGFTMLQAYRVGHDTEVDHAAPLTFDLQKFQNLMNEPKKHLTREYSQLRQNLAHIPAIDKKVRKWLEDDLISPEGAEKWLALLAGIDHDHAEKTLLHWIDDKSVPAKLARNSYVHLFTPRKRTDATIEKLFQLTNKEHENREMAHMTLGAMLKRYKTLEGTTFMPKRIQSIFDHLHRRVHSAATPKELEIALGALGNTHFEQGRATLIDHVNHPDTKVQKRAMVALKLMQMGRIDADTIGHEETTEVTQQNRHARKLVQTTSDGCGPGLFSFLCVSRTHTLTESDHHVVSVTAGLGLQDGIADADGIAEIDPQISLNV